MFSHGMLFSTRLIINSENYSYTNLAPLLPLLPSRFILRFSFCFQRYLTTQGVTVIALAQTFANVAGVGDHAFNHLYKFSEAYDQVHDYETDYEGLIKVFNVLP